MGAGAGYTVTLEGVELDLSKIRISKIRKDCVEFNVPLKKSAVDKWTASDYYYGVDSDGLRGEFGEQDKMIEGGLLYGTLYPQDILDCWYQYATDHHHLPCFSDITRNDYKEFIKNELGKYVDFEQLFSPGWIHCDLDEKEVEFDEPKLLGREWCLVNVDKVCVKMPEIAKNINWYFAHDTKLDEIFYGEEDEEAI